MNNEIGNYWYRRYISFHMMLHQAYFRLDRLIKHRNSSNERGTALALGTMENVLNQLRSFGTHHFNFFYNGFRETAFYKFGDVSDIDKEDYSETIAWYRTNAQIDDYILGRIIESLLFDLQVIDQIIDQGFMAITTAQWDDQAWAKNIDAINHNDDGQVNPNRPQIEIPEIDGVLKEGEQHLIDVFSTTREEANGALGLFYEHFHLEQFTSSLTYFRTAATIRVVPYANVALIGLPITSVNTKRDTLAIPHEVGHFIYWNGTIDEKPVWRWIKERFSGNPMEGWLEEIFADLISALIGGPITLASLQDLLEPLPDVLFLYDDSHHPIPAIRPFIYFHVLRRFLKADKKKVDDWINQWMKVLECRNINLAVHLYHERTLRSMVEGGALIELLDEMLTKIIPSRDRISELELHSISEETVLSWYTPKADQHALSGYLTKQATEWNKLKDAVQASGNQSIKSVEIWASQIVARTSLNSETNNLLNSRGLLDSVAKPILDESSAGVQIEQNTTIFAEEWLRIFEAGGWTTGGGGPSNFKDLL